MGLGIISGAWNLRKKKKENKKDRPTDKKRSQISKNERNLNNLYVRYNKIRENLPEWAEDTDPRVVGIKMKIKTLQDKIIRDKMDIGEVL